MPFKAVKVNPVMKLAELHGKEGILGIYKGSTKGQYSKIHTFYSEEEEIEMRMFGTVSLDSQLGDNLIGKMLRVDCVEIKDVGKRYPLAVAQVEVWEDDPL